MSLSFMKKFEHLQIQLKDLKAATDDFNKSKVIGSGGFGKVYKGEVTHHKGRSLVAIKRLDRQYGQGDPEFWKEIMMLSDHLHENLISLLGYCDEAGEKVLVYELALNGSLDRHLKSPSLSWAHRIKICLDAAMGLCYLHDDKGTQQRVIHRDVKSSNILLDGDWNAKISDMGLSKIGPANQEHTAVFTNAVGTFGYLDPTYLKQSILTKESDVYSFGVVLMEVLCGRLCIQNINGTISNIFQMWAESYNNDKVIDIVHKDLEHPLDPKSLKIFSKIANKCMSDSRDDRPTMSHVVDKLKSALHIQEQFDLMQREYKEILEAAVSPISYKSTEELKKLLSEGVLVNEGNTWFSRNHQGEHYEMISIAACLILLGDGDDCHSNSSNIVSFGADSSRKFMKGCYSTNGKKFGTHVHAQFLSPLVTYTVNLVFKFMDIKESSTPARNLPLKYTLQGYTKQYMVYLGDKSEDEALVAKLYQFTSKDRNIDLKFWFEDHECYDGLCIEGIEFQPLIDVEHDRALHLEYEETLKAVLSPINNKYTKELKSLLFKGVFLNGGKTRLSMNNKEERIQLTSIKECLILDKWGGDGTRYSHQYNSSFEVGSYNTCGESFKTRVTTKLLSPFITYTTNLIFKCPHVVKLKTGKQQYLSLVYELKEGEKKISIVHVADKSEDEWLIAKLLQFTTSDQSTLDLEILFRSQEYSLEIEGIKFQPVTSEIINKYQGIVKSAEPPLFYTSIHQLKQILSKGIHLNSGNRWFYLNDKEQHCEMISIKQCLIPDAGENYPYISQYNSRFTVGTCFALDFKFKIRARAQFLTPSITYSVNLVFKFYNERNLTKQPNVLLKSKLQVQRQTKTSISYLANKRDDEWWMVEFCHFTSQGTIADLEIIIEDNYPYIVVDGIEFLPVELEKEEHQVLKDKKVDDDDMQPPISDSDLDTHWEQKLPIGYQDIIKLGKHSLSMNKTKKELYSIISKGFLINNGQEWLFFDKNGKKCLMLSTRTAIHAYGLKWQSSPESRFEEMVKLYLLHFEIVSKIKSQVLESETIYATYLVYKLPESDQSKFETLVKVMDGKDLDSEDDWGKADFWNVTLISPQIPVIVNGKVDKNTRNPWTRPKIKGIPQQRSDGWMEVQVYEFQTDITSEFIPIRLRLKMYNKWFDGLSIQGIEFRPIHVG